MAGYSLDPVSRDWGAEGIHWTGQPGDEIQRLDDMSDYGGGKSPFDGDMAAALHVARNGFPFVLYERHDIELGAWAVTAYPDFDAAMAAAVEGESDGDDDAFAVDRRVHAFVIDGRKYEEADLPHAPDENGYIAPENALYVHPQEDA